VLPALGTAAEHRADRDTAATEVAGGRAGALLVLRPVDVRFVHERATAGSPMPPKSTSFRPKPRVGLVMRALDA
jgi:uncharacterized protein (DUF1015 family)